MSERRSTAKLAWSAAALLVVIAAVVGWLVIRSKSAARRHRPAVNTSAPPSAQAGNADAPSAASGASAGAPGTTPAGGGMTKGFKFPDYDPQRRLKSMLTGKEARAEAGDHIRITALHVETYHEDGKVDLIVEAPECVFDRKNRVASSDGGVEARSADGRFFISGVGFEWRQVDSHLVLSNRVYTLLSKELLTTTKPNP